MPNFIGCAYARQHLAWALREDMKPRTIRPFLWGYHLHFRASVQFQADHLFRALHPELEAETFLLGLRRGDAVELEPVYLEPLDCGFDPSHFAKVRDDAAHRLAIDPESSSLSSDERHHQSLRARVETRAYKNTVLAQLNTARPKEKPGEYFFSGFTKVGDYDVGVVLRLHYKAGAVPYRLPKVHAEEHYGPQHSLVEAVVDEFFRDCRKALHKMEPHRVADPSGRPVDEILSTAGDRLMETAIWATHNVQGMSSLFNACNVISTLHYESAESVGTMLIARQNHPNIEETIKLAQPVSMRQQRAVRKLLQIAATGDALLCNGASITGFGHVRGIYDQTQADLFEIQFTAHYTWELIHGGHRLMRVAYGTPKLPLKPLNEKKLANDLHRIFRKVNVEQCDELVQLALAACEQRAGAVLIISAAAEEEAKRLSPQSTPIDPIKLTPEIIKRVTSIDGAVILNPDGVCFAIGAILDGLATPEGDSSRGARYNSSMRYISGRKECLAVIISEDGTAEWVPTLRPQISRRDLEWADNESQKLLEQEDLDENRARKLLKWLHDHVFYLSQELCSRGNELQDRFDSLLRDEGFLVVFRPLLVPDPEMNGSYLAD